MNVKLIEDYLDELYDNPPIELNYSNDYELLIAVVLSAQTTDKRVNSVTSVLFSKYKDLNALSKASLDDVSNILRPIGTFRRKSLYVVSIASILLEESNRIVPNDRKFLENLPGVGHKTANVVLSTLYDVPAIAVDTHVSRVSKRLGIANDSDDVKVIEKKLMKILKKKEWAKRHYQLVLFGRYNCKAVKPDCNVCKLKEVCKFYKKNHIVK